MFDTSFGVTDPKTRKESRVRAHMCEKPHSGLSFKRALCVLANNSDSEGEYFQNVDDVWVDLTPLNTAHLLLALSIESFDTDIQKVLQERVMK